MTVDYSEASKHREPRPITSSLTKVGPYELGLKRLLDILFVSIAIPFVAPFIAVMAILIARDGGSAFYSQQRVGRGGKIYRMWKLRTMVVDADKALGAYLTTCPEAAAEWQLTQKLKKDPRITKLGQVLRKSSMDELPQIWNVLIGDMSLVGPRPMMPNQQEMYPGLAYYEQRPGITGTWQVSERNEGSFADRARFDTEYAANMSFSTDMKLLWATVSVVTKGTGY